MPHLVQKLQYKLLLKLLIDICQFTAIQLWSAQPDRLCGGTPSLPSFRFLLVGINVWNSSWGAILSLFTIFPGRGNPQRLTLGLSNHNKPYSVVRVPIGAVPTAKYIYPNYTFWNKKNIKWIWRPIMSWTSAQTALITWFHLTGRSQCSSGVSWIHWFRMESLSPFP